MSEPRLLTVEEMSRVFACIKAFDGSHTDVIEEIVASGLSVGKLAKRYDECRDQRDELLDALKSIINVADGPAYGIAIKAIKKAEKP